MVQIMIMVHQVYLMIMIMNKIVYHLLKYLLNVKMELNNRNLLIQSYIFKKQNIYIKLTVIFLISSSIVASGKLSHRPSVAITIKSFSSTLNEVTDAKSGLKKKHKSILK